VRDGVTALFEDDKKAMSKGDLQPWVILKWNDYKLRKRT